MLNTLGKTNQNIHIMQTAPQNMPGYRAYEYLLVVLPHQPLRERIQKIKADFADQYKTNLALYSKAHLPLVRFTQYGMMEEKIVHRLHCIAMAQAPFKVDVKDFGSFPAHSIFLNIAAGKVALQSLVKTVRTDAQRLLKMDAENKPLFMLEPNFLVGRKLLPWQYETAWTAYQHKHFTAAFIADAMLLLKRPVGELNYQVVQRFQFENLPVATKQGELFG